jgi:hypothetical protein
MVDPAPRVRTAAQVADHAAILHDHVIEAIDRTEATSLFDPLSLLERLVAQVEDLAAVVAGERPNLPADMSCCCSTNPGECPVHEPAEVEGLVRPVPTCRWCQQPIHLSPDEVRVGADGPLPPGRGDDGHCRGARNLAGESRSGDARAHRGLG